MARYRNLVFKGGGVRGIAYIGALQYLYERGVMRSISRVAGTSAGAITALGVSLYPTDFLKFKALADSLDYHKVPSEDDARTPAITNKKVLTFIEKSRELAIFKNVQCSVRLLQQKGWYSSDQFYQWLRSIIAERFIVQKEAYTFADFSDIGLHKDQQPFLDLYITGTDLTNRSPRLFSRETTPDMEVALAVRISMSIPLYFEAIQYQYPGTQEPQYYVDGGIMWNYPINLFDDRAYTRRLKDGANEETLGLFLFTPPEKTNYKLIKSILNHMEALFESISIVQEHLAIRSEKEYARTIFIDDCGVDATDFDITIEDAKYRALVKSGYSASKAFFENKTEWSKFFSALKEKFGWKD